MKLTEMREKSIDELKEAIINWKKELFSSRLQLATHKLENTAVISKAKKFVAQAKTIIKEKESCPVAIAEEVKPKKARTSKKTEVKDV